MPSWTVAPGTRPGTPMWLAALALAAGVAQVAWADCPEPSSLSSLERQIKPIQSVAEAAAANCRLPESEGFRKALLCLEALLAPEEPTALASCTAGLADPEAGFLAAIAADLILRRTEDRLRNLQIKKLARAPLTDEDQTWLSSLSQKLGTDLASLIEQKASDRRDAFLLASKTLGVRSSPSGVSFERFDFAKLGEPSSRESQFLEEHFGSSLTDSIRAGDQAIQVGESVVLPSKRVIAVGRYQTEVASELRQFQDALKDSTAACRNYSSWGASCRRIWAALKEGYGLSQNAMDPDFAAANPGWVKAIESYRRLRIEYGLERSRIQMLGTLLHAAAQDGELSLRSGNARVDQIFGAYFGTLGAAAVIATGGFAAGPVLGVTSAGAIKLGCAGVAISLAVSGGIGAGQAAYGAASLSDFQCRIKDRLLEQGLASLKRAPLDAALFLALPPGISKLSTGYSRTLGTSGAVSLGLARTTVAGGFTAWSASHIPAMRAQWQELESTAERLEAAGDPEGALRLRSEARELQAQATLGTLAAGFPLLAEAISVPRLQPTSPAPRRYVKSLADFRVHTQTHIARVKILGLELLRQNPSRFKDVSPELAAEFMALHDQAKVNASLSGSRKTPFLEELYQNYGKTLGHEDKARAGALVRELNAIDAEVAMAFFRKRNLLTPEGRPNAIAEKLLELEKIADLVDRGKSPVSAEEFGRPMDSASSFFGKQAERVRTDPALNAAQKSAEISRIEGLAELARALERPGVYERSTEGLEFPGSKP